MSNPDKNDEYSIERTPVPLPMLGVIDGQPDHEYSVPSWRVSFPALPGDFDLRVHRSLNSDGAWTLSEASTGMKVYDGWGDHETMDELLDLFCQLVLPKMTPEILTKSIADGREKIGARAQRPSLATPGDMLPTPRTDAWEAEAEDATTYCVQGWHRSRQLERELAEAEGTIAELDRALISAQAEGFYRPADADAPEAQRSPLAAPDWEGALRDLLSGCGRSDETDEAIEKARAFLLKHRASVPSHTDAIEKAVADPIKPVTG